jgi:prevent-host-death family protein
MNISSRDFHQHTGKYMEESLTEPVIIERNGRPSVVLVSYKWYLEALKIMKVEKDARKD